MRAQLRAATFAATGILALGGGAAQAAKLTAKRPLGRGVVVIETNLGYQSAKAAGTGMVLTSSGRVLTNHHVIEGATSIRVVVPGSPARYVADVVGYDTSRDVAVLQLRKAAHLQPVKLGHASSLHRGSRVTAVGNANGTGTLVSAKGSVTALDQTITAQDEGGEAEQLRGLIETNAALQPGDSGGPLLDGERRVVGMDTAASVSLTARRSGSGGGDGFAIPIDRALTIEKQIVAGQSSATVHIGATAWLGVEASSSPSGGVELAGVVSGSPAAAAGLEEGDVITALGGHSISDPEDLGAAVLAQTAGATVSISYVDTAGLSQTANVTLGSGPPQ
jgi:S1-C subfamily serine protease